ncbi:retrotransposable element Tf2 [Tanacetum coccineum]
MSTAYHPQTEGQTKMVNRCLEGYLRCMTGEKPKKWFEWLPLVKLWYNTNFHTSINTIPFEVVYGQTPPIHVPYMGGLSKINAVDRTLLAREEAIKLKLHAQAQIHNVFHVLQLKRYTGPPLNDDLIALPQCDIEGSLLVQPIKLLARKMVKKNNKVVVYGLMKWANGIVDDVSWEDLRKLVAKFSEFNLSSRGQELFKGEGLSSA